MPAEIAASPVRRGGRASHLERLPGTARRGPRPWCFQRAKVRDLYDLHLLARQKFDGDLLRGLVVVKLLWQVRDAFDPPGFFAKLRGGEYDWDDLHRLLRPSERTEQETIIAGIELHFRKLKELTELQAHVVADAKKGARNEPLGADCAPRSAIASPDSSGATSRAAPGSRCAHGAPAVQNFVAGFWITAA